MYDYGLIRFKVILRGKKTGSIIIIRLSSKNIRTARADVLKKFSDVTIVEISFIEYVRSNYVR